MINFVHYNSKPNFQLLFTATNGVYNYSTITGSDGVSNQDSIIFISDTKEIWAHGTLYSIEDYIKTNLNYFSYIHIGSDGGVATVLNDTTYTNPILEAVGRDFLKFVAGTGISLDVGSDGGIKISSTQVRYSTTAAEVNLSTTASTPGSVVVLGGAAVKQIDTSITSSNLTSTNIPTTKAVVDYIDDSFDWIERN